MYNLYSNVLNAMSLTICSYQEIVNL